MVKAVCVVVGEAKGNVFFEQVSKTCKFQSYILQKLETMS